MAASKIVEFYIQENQRLEAATKTWSGKRFFQNLRKTPRKYLRRSPLSGKATG